MLESWYEEAREKLIVVLKSVETKVWAQLGSWIAEYADSVGVSEIDTCSAQKLEEWRIGKWRIGEKWRIDVKAKDLKVEALIQRDIMRPEQRWFWNIWRETEAEILK